MKALFSLVFIVFLIFTPLTILAQGYYKSSGGFTEVGIQGGISGYAGDLGGTLGGGSKQYRDFDWRLPNIMLSINATYEAASWLHIRPNFTVTQIIGDDKSLSTAGANDKSLFYRNLSFKSMIYEVAALAEVNPLYLIPSYAETDHKLFPYGTAGVGLFHFNPKGNLDGKWYPLQSYSLEGQGMQEYPDRKIYKKLQLCLPVGGGFKYYITPGFYAGAEFLYRKTFTDYIDDVSTTYIDPSLFNKYFSAEKAEVARRLSYRSLTLRQYQPGKQRGSPKAKDAYFTFGLRFGVSLSGLE
jgi:hypothetical protein